MKLSHLLLSAVFATAAIASCSSPKRSFDPEGSAGLPNDGSGGNIGAAGSGSDSCEPKAKRCDGDVPQLCGDDGTWEATQTGCAFGCTDGVCNVCEEDSKACEGGQAELCKGGQWQYTPCASQCEAGDCVDACTEGTKQCDGLTKVQLCTDGKFADDETCDGVCVKGKCVGQCKPDAARCKAGSTTVPELCSAQGEWESAPACAAACLGGTCVVCAPDSKRCSPTGRPQTCSEFGTWVDEAPCSGDTPACVEGACGLCVPDARRCSSGKPQQCNAVGTAWVDGAACGGATPSCVASTGQCGTCQEGDTQCGDDVTPQTCDASGKWNDGAVCKGSSPACLNGSCVACAPGATRCVGAAPQLCSNDGQWISQAACTGTTPVCLPATGQCGCTSGAVDCADSNTPETCSASGAWVPQTDCKGDTPACSGGSCVCSEGTAECTSPTAARKCTNSVWKATTCSGGTPICVNGSCAVCTPGTTRCALDGSAKTEQCDMNGAWAAGTTCNGLCSKGACVNVICSTEADLPGAFNFRCRASAAATTPGGTLVASDYILSSWWGTGCLGYDLGSATVYQYQGNTFMRFNTLSRVATTDAGTRTTGTLWLQTDAAGNVTTTEMCDPARKGTTKTGTFQAAAGTSGPKLILNFSDHQETWGM